MKKKLKKYGWLALLLNLLILIFIAIPVRALAEETDPFYEKIIDSGELVIGLSAGYAPYEFHATVNGKDTIVGFDVDIAKKIAKDMGVSLRIVEMNFDALLGALKTGKIDVIISGMSPTPERLKEVNFSTSYMEVKQKLIVKKKDKDKFTSVNDFNQVKVGVQKQSTQEALAKAELLGSELVSLPKGADVILNLQNGKVKAAILESVVAEAYASQDDSLFITDVAFENGDKETAIALPKEAPMLEKHINKSIKEIKEKNLLEGYQKKANAVMFQDEGFFEKYGSYFLKGTQTTLLLSLVGVLIGAVLGSLLSIMKLSKNIISKVIANIYIEFVRGTPLIAQIFLVYFGSSLFKLEIDAFLAGCIALSLNSGAYVAEIIRAGLTSVDTGQAEAARSLGMSQGQSLRFILFPQAIKNILPALGNEFVTVIKESSVVSVIGVTELMFQAGVVQGASFKPFLPILISSFIYFILTFTLSRCINLFEKKLNTDSR